MPTHSRIPIWLIGGAGAWLAYAITLSALHLALLDQWGVAYTIKIYSLNPSEPFSLFHAILVAMVSPGFFILEALSFMHIHVSWLDSAVYNWGKMTLLSSLPAFLVGVLFTSRDNRMKLAGSILGLLLLGGSLLFVLNGLLAQ
ncbi:MAG: hypothetical protein A2Z71_02125 [Chloroflexi bacterium RBG_13_50_21]|nr:MAG: hypothetical protein A2Z71_02125 [Chloroflexi bacterium RBG_13_50_21]